MVVDGYLIVVWLLFKVIESYLKVIDVNNNH